MVDHHLVARATPASTGTFTFLLPAGVASLLALAACSSAAAQPEQRSGIQAPAGWRDLPAIASAARMAASANGVVIDGAQAWGEPAMGCYAVWLAITGGTDGDLAEQIQTGLAAEQIAVSDVRPGDVLAMTVERAPYRGQLRARAGDTGVSAFVCFANQRERAACEASCATLLAAWGKS
jgi:hypothetical protein